MRVALIALTAGLLAAPAAAQQPGVPVPEAAAAASAADAPRLDPRINQLIIYGDDPCPQSSDEEIIVCARLPENDRYRIPPTVRENPDDPAGQSWANRAIELSYAGQMAVLGDRDPRARLIARMAAQEQRHLKHFDALLAERGVRPTLLQPFWRIAGHALGAATALMSPQAAMACTAAVEDEIDLHYSEQLAALGDDEPALSAAIAEFQADEREHRDAAIQAGAEESFGYPLLYSTIRAGCRMAIELSKRI